MLKNILSTLSPGLLWCLASMGQAGRLVRLAFHEAAKNGFAVLRTSEFRPFGCLLFTRGVVFDGRS
jgi:L-fucose mutarotase/ribose pyranase (RbsD/FucU family)